MSKRLLLADDSITIQKVIGITFANEDFQLDIVDNGTSALEHALAQRPDAVLADVYMPGKNGYELCAAIKQAPQLQGVPVLLLAGTFEPFDEDKALQAGADGWITKPFESQALIDRVEELIQSAEHPQPVVPAVEAEQEPEALAEAAVLAEPEEDLWAEPEAFEAEGDVGLAEDLEPLGEAGEAASAEDVWGSISFDEEDLVGDVAEEAGFATEPTPIASAAPSVAVAVPPVAAEGEAWDEDVDEIFDLDEGDIIDEADLIEDFEEPLEEAVVPEPPLEEVFGAVDEEPIGPAEEPEAAVEETVFVAEEPEAAVEETAFAAEEPEAAVEEPVAEVEEPAFKPSVAPGWVDEFRIAPEEDAAEMELETPDFEEFAVDTVETAEGIEPAAEAGFEPEPAFAGGEAEASAAPQSVTLDAAEVERIVARVAEGVVERLAGTLLEKIAWEVVPDLAEGMIKDEIRKIKAALQ